MLLQWHITERCNRRCLHCYQENYQTPELDFEQWMTVIEQFEFLLAEFRRFAVKPVPGHITVTGGEPFIHNRFMDLLEVFASKKEVFGFSILTNGTYLTPQLVKDIKRLNPRYIQLSLEGTRATHDYIRGQGSYDATIEAIKNLVKARIYVTISFTVHKQNFHEFPDVVKQCAALNVNRVWSDRLIPSGSGQQMQTLSAVETKEFFLLMKKSDSASGIFRRSRTEIAMHRALQFLVCGGEPYNCKAGNSLLTLMPNGDVYPCRRMPVNVGNILEKPLTEIYRESDFLKMLRRHEPIDGCRNCRFEKSCRGGLKCLSYSVYSNPNMRDPGCWCLAPK